MACKKESSINTYAASNYSTEEEQILSSIHLPPPITPISDGIINEENSEAENGTIDNKSESVMERLLRTLPKSTSVEFYSKHKDSINSDIYYNKIKDQPGSQSVESQRVLNTSLFYECGNSLLAF